MPYRNSYAGLAVIEEKPWYSETPAEEYDLNFAYSVPQEDLSTGAALIRPLIPSLHAPRLHQLLNVANPPGGYAFLPYGPFPSYPSFLSWLEKIRRDPEALLFVVYDLALDLGNGDDDLKEGQTLREERIAGVVGVLHSRAWDRMTEVGHLHIPAPFQRTHVLSHSIALLLRWILDAPTPSSPSALGLRRAQWFAKSTNTPSITAAKRLGFTEEASGHHPMRWDRVFDHWRDGTEELPAFLSGERREVEQKRGGGRHSVLLGQDWETWENGGREQINAVLAREVKRRKASEVPGLL